MFADTPRRAQLEEIMHDSQWFEQCRQYATIEHLDPAAVKVLAAFSGSGPDEQPVATRNLDVEQVRSGFSELLVSCREQLDAIAVQVVVRLSEEVDIEQARLFSRRFVTVAQHLQELTADSATAGLYLVGLVQRVLEILAAPAPVALRVRAAADFYYSHASVLRHTTLNRTTSQQSTIAELFDRTRWEKITRGIFVKKMAGLTHRGPLRATLLRVERGKATFTAVPCRSPLSVPFDRLVNESGAIAGVSGGFFLYSEPDIELPSRQYDPVGMLIHEGRVLVPPIFNRGAVAWDGSGHVFIQRFGLKGTTLRFGGGKRIVLGAVNAARRIKAEPVIFTRARYEVTPPCSGLKLLFAGNQFLRISQDETVAVPLNGFAVTLPDRPEWERFIQELDTGSVSISPPRLPGKRSVQEAMAGGPILVEDGRINVDLQREDFTGTAPPLTFSRDETFDQNLLPRMAVGITGEHHIIFAAIDGRDFDRSLGLTLHRTARLMRHAGCRQALNLDGGSSKRLVIQGQTVDLSSTDIVSTEHQSDEIRPVHTAILIHAR